VHNVGSLLGDLLIAQNAALPACEAEQLRDAIGADDIAGAVVLEGNTGAGSCQ
jgi:hypothetical protein